MSVKFLRLQWYAACLDISYKVKDKLLKLLRLAPLTTKKKAMMFSVSLDFGEKKVIFHWVYYFGLFTEWPKKLPVLSGFQNKRRISKLYRLLCKLLCCLDHTIQQIQ